MEIFVLVTQLSWPLCRLSAFTEKNFLIKTFYSIFFHIPNEMQDTQKYVGVTPCVFKINKPSYKDISKSFSIISKRLLMVNLSKQIIETNFIEWQNLCNYCYSDKRSPSSCPDIFPHQSASERVSPVSNCEE